MERTDADHGDARQSGPMTGRESIVREPARPVVVYDDGRTRLRRIARDLRGAEGMPVTRAGGLDELAGLMERHDFANADVLVWHATFWNLPRGETLRLFGLLRGARLVVVVALDELLDGAPAMKLGEAWLFADLGPARLADALRLTRLGYGVVPSGAEGGLDLFSLRRATLQEMDPRERGVLEALARGSTNRAIGRELGLTDAVAKALVRRVLGRLNLRNRTEAAVFLARARQAAPEEGGHRLADAAHWG